MSSQTATFINAPVRLDSWKDIAQYLRRGTRTVQRWHAECGLPVRHMGGISTSVFAFSDELDSWLRNHPIVPPTCGPFIAASSRRATSIS